MGSLKTTATLAGFSITLIVLNLVVGSVLDPLGVAGLVLLATTAVGLSGDPFGISTLPDGVS